MTRVYKSGSQSGLNFWNIVLATAIPPAILAPYMVPPDLLLYTYSAIFLPSVYALYDRLQRGRKALRDVAEIHLYENGQQLLVKTKDGVHHKIDIIHNESHRFIENKKDTSLIFCFTNSGREYYIGSKDTEEIDYQLMDKYIRAICIDTGRSQTLYHRLVNRM